MDNIKSLTPIDSVFEDNEEDDDPESLLLHSEPFTITSSTQPTQQTTTSTTPTNKTSSFSSLPSQTQTQTQTHSHHTVNQQQQQHQSLPTQHSSSNSNSNTSVNTNSTTQSFFGSVLNKDSTSTSTSTSNSTTTTTTQNQTHFSTQISPKMNYYTKSTSPRFPQLSPKTSPFLRNTSPFMNVQSSPKLHYPQSALPPIPLTSHNMNQIPLSSPSNQPIQPSNQSQTLSFLSNTSPSYHNTPSFRSPNTIPGTTTTSTNIGGSNIANIGGNLTTNSTNNSGNNGNFGGNFGGISLGMIGGVGGVVNSGVCGNISSGGNCGNGRKLSGGSSVPPISTIIQLPDVNLTRSTESNSISPSNSFTNTTTNGIIGINTITNNPTNTITNSNSNSNSSSNTGGFGIRTLFISGLPTDMLERELWNLCRGFSGFCGSKLIVNKEYPRPVGFAEFASNPQATCAKNALDGLQYDPACQTDVLKVEFAKQNPKEPLWPFGTLQSTADIFHRQVVTWFSSGPYAAPPPPPQSSSQSSLQSLQSSHSISSLSSQPLSVCSLPNSPSLGYSFSNQNSNASSIQNGISGSNINANASGNSGGDNVSLFGNSGSFNSGGSLNCGSHNAGAVGPSASLFGNSGSMFGSNNNGSFNSRSRSVSPDPVVREISGIMAQNIRGENPPSTTLFIGNISEIITESEFVKVFSQFPGFVKARLGDNNSGGNAIGNCNGMTSPTVLGYDSNSNGNGNGRTKVGFVEYINPQLATLVMACMQGVLLPFNSCSVDEKRPVKIEYAKTKIKKAKHQYRHKI